MASSLKRIPIKCALCGKDCTAREDHVAEGMGRFCSAKCAAINRTGNLSPEQRFWKYVDKNGPIIRPELGQCWKWAGPTRNGGYGYFEARGIRYDAHVFSYEFHNGLIPIGRWTCHRCDNRSCTNPSHLFHGTANDNIQDKVSKGRQSRGESQHLSVLKEQQVREIHRMIQYGVTQQVIGDKFGVDRTTIGLIARGKTWRHVTKWLA